MRNLKNLLVVGGGTAGLIAALILKKHLNINVAVVHSKTIGIIGVGEGSTEHFRDFCNFVGINQYDLIKNCDATYKAGIMFSGWSSKDYLHSVLGDFSIRHAQYHSLYAKMIAEDQNYMNYDYIWRSQINKWFVNKEEEWAYNQFHFNTHKLNEFLLEICKSSGITIFEDDIDDVIIDQQGEIAGLQGKNKLYQYDFYIDSTGFKKVLISKLGARWKSFGKFLKMKSAITFPTVDQDNYNLWTLAKAMNYGWLFRIPVWGRYGNGYIFDSDYISAEQAKLEVENLLGHNIEVGKEFKFDPGCLENVWIKNCCAVGLSGSFIEPLEASSIGTTIQQCFLLMHRLINYNDKTIEKYNTAFLNIMENIRDFVVLHYITNKKDTAFWKDISVQQIPDSLSEKLELWKQRLPIYEDFSGDNSYTLFKPANFILVMSGLNLFDQNKIKQEFEMMANSVKRAADYQLQLIREREKNIQLLTHKQFIWLIRNV